MQHRPWWTRNWKWAVPTGCLLVLLLAFGGCVSLFVGAVAAMKNTGAYTQAVERARSHPDAVARPDERAAGDAREDREAEGDDDPGRRGATTAT